MECHCARPCFSGQEAANGADVAYHRHADSGPMEERGTVSSCASGHPISPGAESCAVCGDDVRPRCYQGHRSAAGSRFCETCGAMLAAEPTVGAADLPAADLVTEYTSTPFNEFLMEDAEETGDEGAPPRPDAA